MTRAATARRIEIEEDRFEPLNRIIDAWETLTTDLIERDLEPQLRARLGRLLPPDKPVKLSLDRKIELQNLLALLRNQAGRRHTAAEHEQWAHMRKVVRELIEEGC